MKRILFFAIILSLFHLFCYGQDMNKQAIKIDTLGKEKKIQVMALPVVFYTPETEFGVGGGALFFFKNMKDVINLRESSLLITGIYTSKKQLIINIKPEFYLIKGRLYIDADFKYKLFPNSFWGIGNNMPDSLRESYNMKTFYVHIALLKRISGATRFGLEYIYEKHIIMSPG